jgi:uncharacterized protein
VSDVFADTHYWIAIINPHDQWHRRAVTVSQSLGTVQLVTTDDVLVEVLNFFAGYGALMRSNAAQAMHSILQNANVETLSVERDDFSSGLTLYESRLDKGYSLTDCTAMNAMRAKGIIQVLSRDRHFAQEGFTILL